MAALTARESSMLYDIASSWVPLLGKQSASFLQIFEVPLSTGRPARALPSISSTGQSHRDIKTVIGGIPAQEDQTLRVYFAENFDLQKLLPAAASLLTKSASIASQWSSISDGTHWEIDTYELSLKPMLRGIKAPYIDFVSIAAGTVRRTMKCTFLSTENGQITWHIDIESMVPNLDLLFDPNHVKRYAIAEHIPQPTCEYHVYFCERLRSLIEAHANLGAQLGCTSGYKKMLLLLYSNAVVEVYVHQVYHLQARYARKKEGLSDPRRTKLTLTMLAGITRDISFYEEVKERVESLAGAVDTLVESLRLQLRDSVDLRQFQSLAIDLQSTCTDMKRIMATLSATLESRLRLFELSRGYHETQKTGLLSILASVFLPLSLATGFLSMQTRFVDLHYLLYDFLGVLVLLGSIVIAILVILRTRLWFRELLLRLDRVALFRRYMRPVGSLYLLTDLLVAWALLLSSFLVGMMKDVGLGLKVLGYDLAAAVGIGGPLPLFVLLVILSVQGRMKLAERSISLNPSGVEA